MGAAVGAGAGAGGALLLGRLRRGVPLPVPLAAVAVGVLWALVAASAPPAWWLPVPLVLGWWAVLLTATDLRARRLPDALTLPAVPVAAALLAVAAAAGGPGGLLPRAAVGALLWAGPYAAVRLVASGALGGGDLKLAAPLGAVSAASSWSGLFVALLLASVLTLLVAVPARLVGRAAVAHGPAMLAAAWLVVLAPP